MTCNALLQSSKICFSSNLGPSQFYQNKNTIIVSILKIYISSNYFNQFIKYEAITSLLISKISHHVYSTCLHGKQVATKCLPSTWPYLLIYFELCDYVAISTYSRFEYYVTCNSLFILCSNYSITRINTLMYSKFSMYRPIIKSITS